MDRIKPRDIQLVQRLGQFDKPYWSVADLQKVLGYKDRRTLLVALHRLVRQGVLIRMRRGIYRVSIRSADPAVLANLLYRPSYLSFESALARHGILSQIPYTITLATTRRSKKAILGRNRRWSTANSKRTCSSVKGSKMASRSPGPRRPSWTPCTS
jgi:predicted transcriptional regulator of viral defense system